MQRRGGPRNPVRQDLRHRDLGCFPVSPGHALIVSRRHVANLFELSAEEQAALWALLPAVKAASDAHFAPAGYNVGVNVGTAAGQTSATFTCT